MSDAKQGKLIHVGKFYLPGKGARYLYLRQTPEKDYVWYEADGVKETRTEVGAATIEEAIRLARKNWKKQAFRTLNCGFKYTLPERDEHGINALFHEMVTSYHTPNGVYYDDTSGHHCFIQFASQEALELKKLS